ncbi:MAG: beta-lactamase family protein [Planctomycetes bacterium]|nr:beta-lactamase family protein [Planctomycetota bacterium]
MRQLVTLILPALLLTATHTCVDAAPRADNKATEKKLREEANKKRLADRAARARSNKTINEDLGKTIAAIMKDFAEQKGFSGVVLVEKDGVEIHKAAYGMAHAGDRRKNAIDTYFDMGSVGKHFTAAAILQLEERKKLSLDDTLQKYFKDVPKDKAGITLKQLLSHSSGIGAPPPVDEMPDLTNRDIAMKYYLSLPLAGKPGERFEYTNTNFNIAAAVVELVSKKTYEQYVRENLFVPAGLKETGFRGDSFLSRQRDARRYVNKIDKGSMIDRGYTWVHRGAGFLVSCVSDMQKWSRALEDETILTEESKTKWRTAVVDIGGLGWYINDSDGQCCMSHGGKTPGGRAYFVRYPEADFMFVFFMNSIKNDDDVELRNEVKAVIEDTIVRALRGDPTDD